MAYLTLATYKNLTVLASVYLDEVEVAHPGWILEQLTYWSAVIDARLRKRYAAPFTAPNIPVAVTGWLARLVDIRVLLKRGVDATDAQFTEVSRSATDAMAEMKEAADSVEGLYDLPLASGATAIRAQRPRHYSEASPYKWSREQRCRAWEDD